MGQVCAGWALGPFLLQGASLSLPLLFPLGRQGSHRSLPPSPSQPLREGKGQQAGPPDPTRDPGTGPRSGGPQSAPQARAQRGPCPPAPRLLFCREEPLSQRGRLDAGGMDGLSGSGGPCHPAPNPGPWGSGPRPLLSTLRLSPLPARRGHPGPPRRVPEALPPSRVAPGVTVLAGTC